MNRRIAIVTLLTLVLTEWGWAATASDVDTNHDGIVDFADFLNFAGSYNQTVAGNSNAEPYDFDGNGHVGFSDFLILVSFFGQASSNGLVVNVGWMPDTMTVGQIDTMRVALSVASIPDGSCDSIGFGWGHIPDPDSTTVTLQNFETVHLPDSIVQVVEAVAVTPGRTRYTIDVSACIAFSDTTTVVVIPPE